MTIKQAAMWLCQPGIVSMIHDPTTKKALSVAVKALAESELSTNLASLGTDCISRQQAIDALHMHLMYRMGTDSNKKRLDEWINNLPPAEPKRGKWIDANICGELPVIVCDQCHTFFPIAFGDFHNFCPNCGAKMEVNNEIN